MRRERLLLFSLILACSFQVMGQSKTITGKIIDSAGHALAGASVRVKNATTGTSTGTDGAFSITVKNNATLIISAVGYGTKEAAPGDKNYLEIQLFQSTNDMDEVVVTALGIRRDKRLLTYSSQQLKGDE